MSCDREGKRTESQHAQKARKCAHAEHQPTNKPLLQGWERHYTYVGLSNSQSINTWVTTHRHSKRQHHAGTRYLLRPRLRGHDRRDDYGCPRLRSASGACSSFATSSRCAASDSPATPPPHQIHCPSNPKESKTTHPADRPTIIHLIPKANRPTTLHPRRMRTQPMRVQQALRRARAARLRRRRARHVWRAEKAHQPAPRVRVRRGVRRVRHVMRVSEGRGREHALAVRDDGRRILCVRVGVSMRLDLNDRRRWDRPGWQRRRMGPPHRPRRPSHCRRVAKGALSACVRKRKPRARRIEDVQRLLRRRGADRHAPHRDTTASARGRRQPRVGILRRPRVRARAWRERAPRIDILRARIAHARAALPRPAHAAQEAQPAALRLPTFAVFAVCGRCAVRRRRGAGVRREQAGAPRRRVTMARARKRMPVGGPPIVAFAVAMPARRRWPARKRIGGFTRVVARGMRVRAVPSRRTARTRQARLVPRPPL